MWKKLGVALIALLSTFSVVYAMNRDMFATSQSYSSGGIIEGRLGVNYGSGLYKGDRLDLDLSGQVVNVMLVGNNSVVGKDLWLSMTTESMGKELPFASRLETYPGPISCEWHKGSTDIKSTDGSYDCSPARTIMAKMNERIISGSPIDKLVSNRVEEEFTYTSGSEPAKPWYFARQYIDENRFFVPALSEVSGGAAWVTTAKIAASITKPEDSAFSDIYMSTHYYSKLGKTWSAIGANGRIVDKPITDKLSIRPASYIDTSKIVFATSKGTTSGFGTIKKTQISKSYSSLYNESMNISSMKARIEDVGHTIDLINLQNHLGSAVNEASLDGKIYANISANSGTDGVGGVNTISALIFDSSGSELLFYKPIDVVNASNKYTVGLEGLPLGNYMISFVNENYNDSTTTATFSSPLSEKVPLKIVKPLSDVVYTALPQKEMNKYEYSKNVAPGTTIGQIAFQNGVKPITLSLVADSSAPSGHENDFQNFELESTSATITPIILKIKSNGAPEIVNGFLKAGDYYFEITVSDANGDPTIPLSQKVKLTVSKTSPNLNYVDTSKTIMKVGDASYTSSVTTSNTDTLEPMDITYTINGSASGVLTVSGDANNPLSYTVDITPNYSLNGLPDTYNISASLKATDNFNAVTTATNKSIYAYKGLTSLNFTPKNRTFSTAEVSAPGVIIGSLLAVDGDGPFAYEIVKTSDPNYDEKKGADNASFEVDSLSTASGTLLNVTNKFALIANTYDIQFKVTDSQGDSVYTNGSILVIAENQTMVEFKTGTGGSVISEYKMKYNETNRSLFAEGGSTGATIEYYLANTSDQPSGLVGSADDYVDIAKIGGLVTPKKVGTVNVYAKSPGNATYGDQVSSFMNLIIEQAEQSVKFTNTNATSIKIGDTSQETATGTVTLTNTAGEGGITYKSSDENIATVDANGKVTAIGKGTAIITATLNDSDPINKSYNPNYETKTTTKTVNVYKGMSLTWTAISTNLKGISSEAGDLAGTIAVTDNDGVIKYKLSLNTGVENADAKFFQLDPNNTSCGVKLVGSISAADVASHNNKFYIQVDVTDTKGTQTIDIEITIDNADNDAYFKEGSNKVTKITKQFGENGNAFNFSVNTSNGGSVTYSVVTSQPQDVITTLGTGATTIKKVGTTKAQAVVGAGSGYDGKTITVDVEITKGIQEVTFDDTAITARAFVKDSQFSEPATLSETSAKSNSTRTKTYDSKDKSICTVDQAGLVTMLTKGNCEIEVTNTDSNWITTTTIKTINLYDGMGVVFAQSATLQAETPSATINSIVGKLTISGGQGNKTSSVSTGDDPKNKDAKYFDVKGTNVVLKQNVTAADLANKYDIVKQKYVMYVQFETKDTLNTAITTDAIIEFKGAPLNAEFDTGGTGKITEVYGKERIFLADVINNLGDGTPVYQLKNDPTMPSDVLKSVEQDGTITILNANDKADNAKPVMIEAVIPPNGGYEGKTIEVEVEIVKAEQTEFKFKTPTIKMQTESSITIILEGKLSTGTTKIISPNTTILSVNGMEITAGKTQDTVTITASDAGDRNYKLVTTTASVVISEESAYPFTISVPSATYGDTGLSATIETNGGGENRQQTWVSSDPTIADVDETGNITIYQAGQVDITCTQTTTGEPSATSTATLVIQPKPITITINDKRKYVGESVSRFDMTIPNGVLVPGDTISSPNFSCLDTSNKPVTSTTLAGSYPITGSYPTGANANYAITVTSGTLTVKQDTSLASWYHLEGVTSGSTLDPTKWYNEDVKVVLDTATESAGTYDEISLDQTLWDSTSIAVAKEDENSEDVYFRINSSGILSTSQNTTIKIDKTNPIIKSITGTQTNKDALSTLINNLTFGTFFKPGTLVSIKSEDIVPVANAKISGIQETSYEVFQIDRKTGIMNTTPIDQGSGVLNASGEIEVKLDDVGLYRVCALTKDQAGNVSAESCSDVNVKKIDLDIDNDGENEFQDPDNDGCPDINIALKDEGGVIYKINVDRDDDGIPDLNIDSDGDGIAEINVDTNDDGRPDLNLVILTKWEPTFCATEQIDNEGKPIEYCTMKDIKPLINVDTGNDGIPDIDIDTGGDMKADINIDRNGDGKLDDYDLNLTGEMKAWVPKTDYTYEEFLYDTQSDLKPKINIRTTEEMKPDLNIDTDGDGLPDINIDINGDGIPETNIDSTGDGEPDFNLDPDRTGTPQSNIIKISEWKPNIDGEIDGVSFKTMDGLKMNDTLVDDESGIQIQKPGGSFLPNYSIKVNDIKDTVDPSDKGKIEDYVKGDTEIKGIYDVKLSDGTTTLQPDGSVKVRIPVSDEVKDAGTIKVIIEQADGSYKEVNATIKDGYIEYETEYLGKVGIIADKSVSENPNPDPEKPDVEIPDFKPNGNGGSTPGTTVKGDYTSGIGGAGTGDETKNGTFMIGAILSIIALFFSTYKRSKEE